MWVGRADETGQRIVPVRRADQVAPRIGLQEARDHAAIRVLDSAPLTRRCVCGSGLLLAYWSPPVLQSSAPLAGIRRPSLPFLDPIHSLPLAPQTTRHATSSPFASSRALPTR